MLESKFTSKMYDDVNQADQENVSKYGGNYYLNKMPYLDKKSIRRNKGCSKMSQSLGVDAVCSENAYYARNPSEIADSVKKHRARKTPKTHYLTYDDTCQNREQENIRMKETNNLYKTQDRFVTQRFIPEDTVQLAKSKSKKYSRR